MFSRFTSKMVAWFLNAIELQLFLMVTSLPILVCWGLPISLLALFGNIIFTPFLCLFLGLSALMCFLALFEVQLTVFSIALDYVTDVWYWLMSYANSSVLLYLPQPPVLLLLMPIALLITLYFHPRSMRAQIIRIAGIIMIIIVTVLVWKIANVPRRFVIGNNQCVIDKNSEGLIIEYSGKAPRNIDMWIRYTLISTCAKKFGTLYCSVFEIKRLTPSMLPLTQAIINEFAPRKIQFVWCFDDNVRSSWELLLESKGYKKKKGSCYALPDSK